MLRLSDFIIEDWEFDLVRNDWGAKVLDIKRFIEELAEEFGTTWKRESDAWILHNIDDDAYIDLRNSLEDRIAFMAITKAGE